MHHADQRFFPQERELLQVYARYAASALDGARALMEAQQRYDQSAALLDLARALARAGTSREVALRLVDAVPSVVDCDGVGVYLWDSSRGELVRQASHRSDGVKELDELKSRAPAPGGPLERLLNNPAHEPIFVDADNGDPILRELAARLGAKATIVVPLATADALLGLLAVSVTERPERLKPGPDLLDRLSGVAAPRSRTARWSTRSPTRRCTTSSPGWPTASSSPSSCASRSTAPGSAASRSPCSTSTSTDSSRSTTSSATRSAISCWSPWVSVCWAPPGPTTRWPGWAATSSRS